MPRKQKPDKTIQEYMVVEDPAAIKLLFTPKYANISSSSRMRSSRCRTSHGLSTLIRAPRIIILRRWKSTAS